MTMPMHIIARIANANVLMESFAGKRKRQPMVVDRGSFRSGRKPLSFLAEPFDVWASSKSAPFLFEPLRWIGRRRNRECDVTIVSISSGQTSSSNLNEKENKDGNHIVGLYLTVPVLTRKTGLSKNGHQQRLRRASNVNRQLTLRITSDNDYSHDTHTKSTGLTI